MAQSYKKFGVGNVDFSSLVQGQKAVGDSFKEALGGVEDLLNTQEQKYKDENTLNVQEYLKGKVRNAGLGADPIDTTDIKRRFGSMVDMDQLDSTIKAEGRVLEEDAINTAAQVASQSLSESNDPLAARKAFTETLRAAGAKQSLLSSATQAWNDSNAVAIKDAETLTLRKGEERFGALLEEVRGGEGGLEAIEALVSTMPEAQQNAERKRLRLALEDEAKLSDTQKDRRKGYIDQFTIQANRKVAHKQQAVDTLEAQVTALQKTGISDGSYDLAKSLGNTLGNTPINAIKSKVTNWAEDISPESDGKVIKRLYNDLVRNGGEADDVNAAITQAFQENYAGDGILFNDLGPEQMEGLITRAHELSSNAKNKTALNGELSAARIAVADEEAAQAMEAINLRERLTQAGKDANLRKQNADGIDSSYRGYLESRLKRTEPQASGPAIDPDNVATVDGQDIDLSDPNQLIQIGNKVKGLGSDAPPDVVGTHETNPGVDPRVQNLKQATYAQPLNAPRPPGMSDAAYDELRKQVPASESNVSKVVTSFQAQQQGKQDKLTETIMTARAKKLFSKSPAEQDKAIQKLRDNGQDQAADLLSAKLSGAKGKGKSVGKSTVEKEVEKLPGMEPKFKDDSKLLGFSFKNITPSQEVLYGTKGKSTNTGEKAPDNAGLVGTIKNKVVKTAWPRVIEEISGDNPQLALALAKALGIS